VQRRLTEALSWADEHTLLHHEGRCAPQQNSVLDFRNGSN
jgi:hypothetical protein